MNWKFWKKPVQTLEVVADAKLPEVHHYTEPVTHINKGTWVRTPDGRIGIAHIFDGQQVTVVLTKADGTNVMELVNEEAVPATITYTANQLKRASISEIPQSRYESVEQLRSLGYGD